MDPDPKHTNVCDRKAQIEELRQMDVGAELCAFDQVTEFIAEHHIIELDAALDLVEKMGLPYAGSTFGSVHPVPGKFLKEFNPDLTAEKYFLGFFQRTKG